MAFTSPSPYWDLFWRDFETGFISLMAANQNNPATKKPGWSRHSTLAVSGSY
ncbi:MAG: hypothetical protein LBI10_09170 [Deltaproteobacteria bacterium]|nr:hypothetical protein [Deltaproteobacteria bacterium]